MTETSIIVKHPVAFPDGQVPLAVVIHAFYPDVLADILQRLLGTHFRLYLYVTTSREACADVHALLRDSGLPFMLMQVSNRGRDVLPFLKILPYVHADGIAVLLKLHTKKSRHLEGEEGARWAAELFDQLISSQQLSHCVRQLSDIDSPRLVGPVANLQPVARYLRDGNPAHLADLARRSDITLDKVLEGEFYVGTMFFAEVQPLMGLLKLGLDEDCFEPEAGQVDGTLAHAMERFFYVFVTARDGDKRDRLYRRWLTTRQLATIEQTMLPHRIAQWPVQPGILAVIVDPLGDPDAIRRSMRSLQAQHYGAGAILVFTDSPPHGIEAAEHLLWLPLTDYRGARLNEVLRQIDVDWLWLLRAGDRLDPHALLLLADRIWRDSRMAVCYTDEDGIRVTEHHSPVFKPDFSLDLLRSYPYVGRALAFSRSAWLELGGLDHSHQGLAAHDLLLRLVEARGLDCVGHLAEVLVHLEDHLGEWLQEPEVAGRNAALISTHLERLGVAHRIEPGVLPLLNRVRYLHAARPLVSIIVPTKDQLPLLRRCIESLLERTSYPHYEVLIVDNGSTDPDAREWLDGVARLALDKVRVLNYPHPFNYSAINNFAAHEARGDYLVLLNNDTGVVDGDWLDALLNHAQRPEVGAVGAKLHHLDGTIQHGGVVLGLRGPAEHAFIGDLMRADGYMHRLQVDQNYSAVTAACLMIRREVFAEVGGLDEEAFAVSYNDVDLCLKIGQAGYLLVWTPYAVLMHEGSVSQRKVDTANFDAKVGRFRRETEQMYGRWLPQIAHDPAYNPNLSLYGTGFALDHRSELGWWPFAERVLPYVLCHPADPYGCGHYRIRQPFEALRDAGMIEGAISERLLTIVETERARPDTVVFQRQLSARQASVIEDTQRYSQAFRVYELDDYLVDLPAKNMHRQFLPADIGTLLKGALRHCDRFVVSTEALADALSDYHPNIVVRSNNLPLPWWDGLKSLRRQGRKPRVGWAGGTSHTGDLELIVDVVKALAKEVEWVFFGMCIDELKPYIHEFHMGVTIDHYPRALANLNLDLAVAPLEANLFNDCKTNLRLLEFGVLGWPVVCSDVPCFQVGDLPVTRVPNRTEAWIDAIRDRLRDLDATAREGDRLQAAIRENWMLSGENLMRWQSVWVPD